METIFKNTIKKTLNTPTYRFNNRDLLPHQNRLISTIWEKERRLRAGSYINGELFFSRQAILADPINTGLFETIFAYISNCKTRQQNHTTVMMHPFSTSQVFSISRSKESIHKSNLLIVNNNYINIIKKQLDDTNELSYTIIKRQNQLTADLITSLETSDLVILPTSQLHNAITFFNENNYIFHRCFIEDNSALNTIAREVQQPKAEFTWVLSEHWTRLLWPDLDFNDLENVLEWTLTVMVPNAPKTMRDYIQFEKIFSPAISPRSLLNKYCIFHPLSHALIVLSDVEAIMESMQIKPEKNITLKYSYDDPLQIVHSILSTTVGDQIANNNIYGAVNSIGAQLLSPDLWSLEKSIYIRRGTDEDTCPICYEKLEYPTVTDCCRKLFCAQCIIKACRANRTCICPMCRSTIFGNRLLVVAPPPAIPDYQHPNKMTALTNYLNINRNRPTLIYFPYEPRLGKLKAKCKLVNIPLEILTGNRFDSQRKMDKFNISGGVLVITDIKQLYGHQLQSTAILIFYTDNISPTITQVLRMHTYSLAREAALEVVAFVEDAALIAPSNPGTAEAPSGGINTNLGDSSVATSHT